MSSATFAGHDLTFLQRAYVSGTLAVLHCVLAVQHLTGEIVGLTQADVADGPVIGRLTCRGGHRRG